ncbi:hypothetical protein D3C73_1652770 [compost metagenome]
MPMMSLLQQQQDFADREQAQHQHNELDTVGQMHAITGEAVYAAVGVDTDR